MSKVMQELRQVAVTRYVTPLREGGSLPAIAEGDDGFLYVLKFRGAGQGVKSLIAELIGGEIARLLGLRVPEIVFASLDAAFGRSEPDEEIQDLLKASVGLNLGLHYLQGSITFDPVVNQVDSLTASRIVWLDALLTNVDRTVRNTNMLVWNKELWLIDHGAALYFHHSWDGWEEMAVRPFAPVKDHVLLPMASRLEEVDADFRAVLTPELIRQVVGMVPDAWLTTRTTGTTTGTWTESPEEVRRVYSEFLIRRLQHSATFINEALHARKAIV
ncbi:HipA family kinase [Puia sp.]|uniref:HipA family kinase n=1 Tax=Puia sp. TaxID=2045100 RepID=UPI002F413B03